VRLPDAVADLLGGRHLAAVEGGQSGARVLRTDDGGPALYLKIGEGHAAALVADEIARLRWLAGRMPAPQIVAFAETCEAAWLLTEALPGVPFGAWVKQDRRRAVVAAEAMAGFLRRLHALPVDECPFDSSVAAWLPVVRGLVAEGLVDVDDFDDEHAGWSAEQVLAKVEALAGHAQGRVVVHGDFSLGNLIVDDAGLVCGCIDVGRLGVGDPYRDIFIGWRDLGGFGEEAQRAFMVALGMEGLEVDRRDLHRALDELF
jgi:aminoglycoside 3'-phosphotransferase I